MIKNDFCIDVTDRELDVEGIHFHLNKLLSISKDLIWDGEYLTGSIDSFVLSEEFIDFMDYMEKMEYIPSLLLLRGRLSNDMYKFISRLCRFEFFSNMRYLSKNTDYSKDLAKSLLSSKTLQISVDYKIFKLSNIDIVSNMNELITQAELEDISYSELCYLAVVSLAISMNK